MRLYPIVLQVVLLFVAGVAQVEAQSSPSNSRLNDLPMPVLAGPIIQAGRSPVEAPGTLGITDSASVGPNYWAEGAAIGAVALGLPTLLLGFALCEGDDCGSSVAITTLGAAAAGAFIGAMIGGAIEKPREGTASR